MDLQDGLKSSLNKLRIRSRNRGSFRNKHLNIGSKAGGTPYNSWVMSHTNGESEETAKMGAT